VPIGTERINGEVRYLVHGDGSRVDVGPGELAALALARRMLDSLEGTQLVEDLDRLRQRASRGAWGEAGAAAVSVAGARVERAPALVRAIDLAIRQGHRLAFDYRGAADSGPRRDRRHA
jgi:predicted DNA-binding transcriptional regulator YafY